MSGRAATVKVAAITLVGFALAGGAAGVLWEALWTPPDGIALRGDWFLNPAGPDVAFTGVALYVVIGLVAGLILGVAGAMVSRGGELVTLGSVLVASALAGALTYSVGNALGPPDPHRVAASTDDFEHVPGDLVLSVDADSAPWASTALLAWPMGSLTGVAVVYLMGSPRRSARAHRRGVTGPPEPVSPR